MSYKLFILPYPINNQYFTGFVKDLKELDKYPWTSHSTILGKRKNPLVTSLPSDAKRKKSEKRLAEKTIEDVLLHFGDNLGEARRGYRQFVKDGMDQGSRPELQGGGLVRSAGGKKAALLGRKKEDRELSDERILGSGDFACPVKCICLSISLGWSKC